MLDSVALMQQKMPPSLLEVAVEEPVFVLPDGASPKGKIFLHNIEQRLLFNIEMSFIYRPPLLAKRVDVVEHLKESLAKVLVPYHFLAGRLSLNKEEGRIEINCNRAGVYFTGATASISISELGDLTTPKLEYKQLYLYVPGVLCIEDIPLLTVQVTKFACGGFTVSFCSLHTVMDGISLGNFFTAFARVARGEAPGRLPNPDRGFLKARSPLKISFAHTGLVPLPCIPAEFLFNPLLFDPLSRPVPDNVCFKTFNFSPSMLAALKQRAMSESAGCISYCSSFEALVAHVWQARTRAMMPDEQELPSRLFLVVDIRKQLSSSVPANFCGNAITTAPCTSVSAAQVRRGSLAFCVEQVQETIRSAVSEEFVRSEVDWSEVNRGVLDVPGSLLISTWAKLGYEGTDFGWGRPAYVAPLVHGMTEYVIFASSCAQDEHGAGGVDVFIGLDKQLMERFESYIGAS